MLKTHVASSDSHEAIHEPGLPAHLLPEPDRRARALDHRQRRDEPPRRHRLHHLRPLHPRQRRRQDLRRGRACDARAARCRSISPCRPRAGSASIASRCTSTATSSGWCPRTARRGHRRLLRHAPDPDSPTSVRTKDSWIVVIAMGLAGPEPDAPGVARHPLRRDPALGDHGPRVRAHPGGQHALHRGAHAAGLVPHPGLRGVEPHLPRHRRQR